MPPLRSTATVAAVAAVALAAAACWPDRNVGPFAPAGPTGQVRLVNLVTDPARVPLDALLDNVPFGVSLGYTHATPAALPSSSAAGYAAVLAGNRSLVLKRSSDTSVTLGAFTLIVPEAQHRTVYLLGGTRGGVVTTYVTTDDNQARAAGEARLRIANMSPSGGTLDVFVTAPGAELSAATAAVQTMSFRDVSYYLTLPVATYQLRFVPSGTPPAGRAGAVRLDLPSVAPGSGAGFTVVAADRPDGGVPLQGFVLKDR